jgi:CRISPR-associated exonuclease Cas4
LIPIEVKSAFSPAVPYASHQMQLLTYCVLVEEETGARPPYGLLRYRDRTHMIAFTQEAEARVLACAAAIRAARRQNDVARSHEETSLCRHCGYQRACGTGVLHSLRSKRES